MARKWDKTEENIFRKELETLYVTKNLSIGEIAKILQISESGVYVRLLRLNIPTNPQAKSGYNNILKTINIPSQTEKLAEFFGIMLGDGHVSPTQVIVTLGTKEEIYVKYVSSLMSDLFNVEPKISVRKFVSIGKYHRDVYFGSVVAVRWLMAQGLVPNKVKSQVGIPDWIFSKPEFARGFLRGFFDTDGSVYKLRFGIQISFTNHSLPILLSLQKLLKKLEYNPSCLSGPRFYLTEISGVKRFFEEIKPANKKHQERFSRFCVGV